MSIYDDVLNAMRIVTNEHMRRDTATIHHPNCALLKPDAETRGLTLLDCNCGGALFPVKVAS